MADLASAAILFSLLLGTCTLSQGMEERIQRTLAEQVDATSPLNKSAYQSSYDMSYKRPVPMYHATYNFRTENSERENGYEDSARQQNQQANPNYSDTENGADKSEKDYTRQLPFVGLQIAQTSVAVLRLHGAVWGDTTYLTGVGALEVHQEGRHTRVPRLLPTRQSVWMTNRELPPAPSIRPHSRMCLQPPPGTSGSVPVQIRDASGRPEIIFLPIMPHVVLQALPDCPSAFVFHQIAWLFWPFPRENSWTDLHQSTTEGMVPIH